MKRQTFKSDIIKEIGEQNKRLGENYTWNRKRRLKRASIKYPVKAGTESKSSLERSRGNDKKF